MNRLTRGLGRRVAEGIAQMFWPALGCAIVATAVYSREGRQIVSDGGAPLPQLLAVYVLGGLASGAILGALKPYTRSKIGLTLVWIAALLPFTFAIVILSRDGDLRALDTMDVSAAIIFAFVSGPVAAAVVYIRERDSAQERRSKSKDMWGGT